MKKKNETLASLPYGTVILYRKRLYFKTEGLEADIVTAAPDGNWFFVRELKWETFKVVYRPKVAPRSLFN
jgi:hypothetical protein